MNRYKILLGKPPPPAVPTLIPKPTNLDKIRESLLSGKLPFHVDDVVVRPCLEDPSVLEIDVLFRPIYPLERIIVNYTLNNSEITANRNGDAWSTPALGSALHRHISPPLQFYDVSWVASPPDPNARILSIDNPDSFPGITTGRFSGGIERTRPVAM